MTLATLTAHYLQCQGWLGDTTERRQGPISRDYLGFADSVWILGDERLGHPVRVLAVQHSDASNAKRRLRKIAREPRASEWLRHGGEILVLGWGRAGVEITARVTCWVTEEEMARWR